MAKGTPEPKAPKPKGGYQLKNGRMIAVRFDEAMFARINSLAALNRQSFAAAVRHLVNCGMGK